MATMKKVERDELTGIAQRARRAYVERIAGGPSDAPWWTAVVVTASSARQAERYRREIQRRRETSKLPPGVLYLVVADIDDTRIGSGGATINGLRALAETALRGEAKGSLESWWEQQRVLMIHSGGDSRRLPEYSLAGKLFSALPVKTPWGEVSTVFDEMLALSTAWAQRAPSGLVVSSGDVILTFPAEQLEWDRPGVCGAAMPQPVEMGSRHGVYVVGDEGRVYSFLQKPSAAEIRAAGGMLPDGKVALDIGLLRFDSALSARLMELAVATAASGAIPVIDLYQHITLALTGEWSPGANDEAALKALGKILHGTPFWCSLVEGDFTHIGTTAHFQRLMTGESDFTRLYSVQQRLGSVSPPGVNSAGVIVDSVLAGGSELGSGAIAIECDLKMPVRAGRGAILHGLTGLPAAVEVPDETVVHQVPVTLEDGRRGTVVRVYGVEDDPKATVGETGGAWLGRPMLEVLEQLGLEPDEVWPGVPAGERCLWNARLYALDAVEQGWDCARWLMGLPGQYSLEKWREAERLSLATSALWADSQAIADARGRRMQANWRLTAVALATSGTDVRPLLAHAPGVAALASAGRELQSLATDAETSGLTEAASGHFQASLFFGQAGLEQEAEQARARAFGCVQRAVDEGGSKGQFDLAPRRWRHNSVRVSAPARIDLGGGWSDTPPFCLDWGGTVLNIALALNGEYPIATTIRRLDEPLLRCISGEGGEVGEYRTTSEAMEAPSPGSPLSIPRAALRLAGIISKHEALEDRLASLGGGLEIRTEVNLPMGSGLGTSSILAATLLEGLAAMTGATVTARGLSDQVMRLEQLLTTGGGWQDQAGGIFPGAKIVRTGPGLRQRLRVEPVAWSPARQAEFMERFVICYTGIRRVAKDLLAQVVGNYLARQVATVQVLHSIKTLAEEMSYAMREGEWDYLGRLIDRHWQLNQVLDPHTTNAPIDALLEQIRPCLAGAKLAGAGGGGFLLLLAKSPEQAKTLRERLSKPSTALPGAIYEYQIADEGLRIEKD